MKRGPGDQSLDPAFSCDRALKGGTGEADGGAKWIPQGFEAQPISPEDQVRQKQDDDAKMKRRIDQARRIWGEAGRDSIDGGSGHRRIVGYVEGRGVRVSWLPGSALPASLRFHPECPDTFDGKRKRWNKHPAILAKIIGAEGEFEGVHRLFLDRDSDRKRPAELGEAKKKLGKCSGRTVRLSENLSSGVLVLCEGWETGIAIQAAVGTLAAVWPALDADSLKRVTLPLKAIQFGSTSSIHTIIIAGDLDESDAGQKAAAIAANSLRKRAPWLTVVTRFPSVGQCELDDESTPLGLVEHRGGRDVPVGTAKSVDWLDVFAATGGDRSRVRRMLFADLDLEANQNKAIAWRPGDHREYADPGADAEIRYAPDSALQRARTYLLDEESPPEASRPGSRFYLARWGEHWWEWDRRRWVRLDDEHLRGRVWHWLDQFYTEKRNQTERLNPTRKMVDDVLAAMTTDTAVVSDTVPCWLPPSFDRHGVPLWGQAAPGTRRATAGKPEASEVVSFRNGILDVQRLRERREVVWADHDPTWFSTSSLPYDLPIRDLREAMRGSRQAAEVLARTCPTWLKFLSSAWDDENARKCLQEWFGLSMTSDNSLERLLLVPGPPGSGKGTTEAAWVATIGEENVASTSFDMLTGRFHMATLVGKNLAIMADAEIGRFTDTTKAIEAVKTITGNGMVPIEEKYRRDTPSVRLFVRFAVFCNEMPKVLDAGGALAERICLLPMEKSFRKRADPTLKARVVKERAGIAIWALLGLLRLQDSIEARRRANEVGDEELARRDVFSVPDRAPSMVEEFRRDSSRTYAFAADCCELGAEFEADWPDVQRAYNAWALENGYKAVGASTLSRQMNGTVPGLVTKQRGEGARSRYVIGLRLNPYGLELLHRPEDGEGGGQGLAYGPTPDAPKPAKPPAEDAEESPWNQ